jgi:hypothetical protein
MTEQDHSRLTSLQALLSGPSRTPALLRLAAELTLAARGSYVEAGLNESDAVARLRCLNELQIVVGKQIASSVLGQDPAYPDEAFVLVLQDKSASGDCEMILREVLDRMLRG